VADAAGSEIRFRAATGEPVLEVRGIGEVGMRDGMDDFEASIDVVNRVRLTSLKRALSRYVDEYGSPAHVGVDPRTGVRTKISIPGRDAVTLALVDAAADRHDVTTDYGFLPEPVSIALRDSSLLLRVECDAVSDDGSEPQRGTWERLLLPLMRRRRVELRFFDAMPIGKLPRPQSGTDPEAWLVTLHFAIPMHGRDVGFALAQGREILALVDAATNGKLDVGSFLDLVAAGRLESIIGQPESQWLDCKRQPYRRDGCAKWELAKDVAAFANGAVGGFIVIGLRTAKRSGQDVIVAAPGIPSDSQLRASYLQTIRQRIYPYPRGIRIETTPAGSNEIVVIVVPRQAVALRPFLVRGVLSGGLIRGSFITVPTREGDSTVASDPAELHALLVAGRAALGYEGADDADDALRR
jgi:Putative DNA-binding domain